MEPLVSNSTSEQLDRAIAAAQEYRRQHRISKRLDVRVETSFELIEQIPTIALPLANPDPHRRRIGETSRRRFRRLPRRTRLMLSTDPAGRLSSNPRKTVKSHCCGDISNASSASMSHQRLISNSNCHANRTPTLPPIHHVSSFARFIGAKDLNVHFKLICPHAIRALTPSQRHEKPTNNARQNLRHHPLEDARLAIEPAPTALGLQLL